MSTIYPGSQLPTDEVSWVSEERPETRTRPPPNMSLESNQVVKLLCLMMVASITVLYRPRFNKSFGAYEQLANRVEESGAASDNIDLDAVRFVLQVLVEYKELLWNMAFAMFVLIITSALLLIQLKYGKSPKQATKIMLCLVEVLILMVLSCLFTARFYIAKILKLHLQGALESANRLTDTNEFNNELNCSIVPRENLPSCARSILSEIGPDRAQECLFFLCLLTGAYILSMFRILYQLSLPTLSDHSATDDIHTQHTQSMALSSVYEP